MAPERIAQCQQKVVLVVTGWTECWLELHQSDAAQLGADKFKLETSLEPFTRHTPGTRIFCDQVLGAAVLISRLLWIKSRVLSRVLQFSYWCTSYSQYLEKTPTRAPSPRWECPLVFSRLKSRWVFKPQISSLVSKNSQNHLSIYWCRSMSQLKNSAAE